MLKKLFGALVLLTTVLTATAQAPESKICITPYLCEEVALPQGALNSMNNKLLQMATQNNFGSRSNDFVLTVNTTVADKQITASVPAQYIVDLELTFYVVGIAEQVIVNQTAVSVRGIGRTNDRAYISAINHINPRTPALRRFMTEAREKIVDYYATRVPVLCSKAQSLADRGEYEKALGVLGTIPESVEEYPMIAEKMTATYVQMLDKYATVSLQTAKSKMVLKDYEGALEELGYVDPMSSRFDEACKMVDTIKATLDAREQAEMAARLEQMEMQREMAQKMHDDEMMMRKKQLEASQKSASERASAQMDSTTNSLQSWLFGKLQ